MPEIKRDPFGFTKRTFVGYGQMAGKFFSNRYVVIGLLVACLEMCGLVGISKLLARAQGGGISRTGVLGFSLLAAVILATIFTTWLKRSQSGAVLGAPDTQSNNAVLGMVAAFS